MKDIYIKGFEAVYVNLNSQFVYETYIFISTNKMLYTESHRYFYTDIPLESLVPLYKLTDSIEIQCALFSAPLNWLRTNGYTLYRKPIKAPRKTIKKKV